MRFLSAWEGISNQNTVLKLIVAALTISLVTVAGALAFSTQKPPLVIERACFSKAAKTQVATLTKNEIEVFFRLAVEKRFNTNAGETESYLSLMQRELRRIEQDELKNRGMKQLVFVNQVKVDGEKISLDCDRLISVGEVRSALPFRLSAKIETVERTEINPYGLVLTEIENINKEGGRK